jgi:hypothetical protein
VTEYRLTSAKHHHVLVVICLNRVSLDGYASPDEAIAKLIDLGYKPELRYQLNPNWLAIRDPDDPRCLVKSEDIEPIPLPTAVS